MNKFAILTDVYGNETGGSDRVLRLDGRWGVDRIRQEVAAYVKTFDKNFKWKSQVWTHYFITNSLRKTEGKMTFHKVQA